MTRLALVLLLTLCGCGGGGASVSPAAPSIVVPPAVEPSAIDYRQYAPYQLSHTGLGTFGSWVATVVDPNTINVEWVEPNKQPVGAIEEHRIREYAGRQWMVVDAYGNTAGGPRWPIRATRVEIDEGAGWEPLPAANFNPYIPIALKGRTSVRQWGYIVGNDCKEADPAKCPGGKRYFWQHTMTPVGLITNGCWRDGLTNTRDAIKQEEAWWDSMEEKNGGWLERSTRGEMGVDGWPTGAGINYQWFQTIAKGAGYLWSGTAGACLFQ